MTRLVLVILAGCLLTACEENPMAGVKASVTPSVHQADPKQPGIVPPDDDANAIDEGTARITSTNSGAGKINGTRVTIKLPKGLGNQQ